MKLFFRILRYWIPALLWLFVIALESLFLSSAVTGSWLWRLLRELHISISLQSFFEFHHYLRKTGHVIGYGILTLLVFRAWYYSFAENTARLREQLRPAKSPAIFRCSVLALAITITTATLDEWHQSFDPARTGSVRDVGLDSLGGVIFLATALFIFKLWRNTPRRQMEAASV